MIVGKTRLGLIVPLLVGIVVLAGYWSFAAPGLEPQQLIPAVFQEVVTAEETIMKSFETGDKPKVMVNQFIGSIQVKAGAGKTVKFNIVKRAGGQTKADA